METPNEVTATEASSSRREFFKKALFYTSAGVMVQILAKSITWAAGELKLIDMTGKKRTDADNTEMVKVAQGLGYVDNLDAALKAKKTTKADKPGAPGKIWTAKEQVCENCALFNITKVAPVVPSCALMAKILVNPKGSCNSWAPKV